MFYDFESGYTNNIFLDMLHTAGGSTRLRLLKVCCFLCVFFVFFLGGDGDPEVLFGLIFGASGLTWQPMGSLLKVLDRLWRLMGLL